MHFGIKTLHKIKFYFINRIVGEMGHDVPGAILNTAPHFGQPMLFFSPIFLTWLPNCILTLSSKGKQGLFEGLRCFECGGDIQQECFHNAVFFLPLNITIRRQREEEWLRSRVYDRHQHSHTSGYLHLLPA